MNIIIQGRLHVKLLNSIPGNCIICMGNKHGIFLYFETLFWFFCTVFREDNVMALVLFLFPFKIGIIHGQKNTHAIFCLAQLFPGFPLSVQEMWVYTACSNCACQVAICICFSP